MCFFSIVLFGTYLDAASHTYTKDWLCNVTPCGICSSSLSFNFIGGWGHGYKVVSQVMHENETDTRHRALGTSLCPSREGRRPAAGCSTQLDGVTL